MKKGDGKSVEYIFLLIYVLICPEIYIDMYNISICPEIYIYMYNISICPEIFKYRNIFLVKIYKDQEDHPVNSVMQYKCKIEIK